MRASVGLAVGLGIGGLVLLIIVALRSRSASGSPAPVAAGPGDPLAGILSEIPLLDNSRQPGLPGITSTNQHDLSAPASKPLAPAGSLDSLAATDFPFLTPTPAAKTSAPAQKFTGTVAGVQVTNNVTQATATKSATAVDANTLGRIKGYQDEIAKEQAKRGSESGHTDAAGSQKYIDALNGYIQTLLGK